jgi:hypothetical protein
MNNQYDNEYTIHVTKFPKDKVRKTIIIREEGKILKRLDSKYSTERQKNLLYKIGGIQKGLRDKDSTEIRILRRTLRGGHIFKLLTEYSKTDLEYILNPE